MQTAPFIQELKAFYAEQYVKEVRTGNDTLDAWFAKNHNAHLYNFSARNRITRRAQLLLEGFVPDPTDMITTCLKVFTRGTEVNYGYIYSHAYPDGSFKHKYICIGPTFQSQDGEYRTGLTKFIAIFGHAINHSDVAWHVIDKMIVQKIETYQMRFREVFYYPPWFKNKDAFEADIANIRAAKRIFTITWSVDYPRFVNETIENHINAGYINAIYDPADKPVYDQFVKLTTEERLLWISRVRQYTMGPFGLQCGQKIIPASVYEATRIGDIMFAVWRELYIARLCTNLVLNFVSPSFPLTGNWFLIHNCNAELFDNYAMHARFANSHIAANIISVLKNIDRQTRTADGEFLNAKFMRLSHKIHQSFVYADRDIRLSNLGICAITEHVGRTFRDMPALIKRNTPDVLTLRECFEDFDMFSKLMFEFVYAFYAMNSHLTVYHGDLHLNNITLMQLERRYDDQYVCYVCGGKNYVFQQNNIYSTIIDFSRSVIADQQRIESEFGERYAKLYFAEQSTRVLHNIAKYFPKTLEQYPQLRTMIATDLPLIFKAMTSIDTYTVCSNIAYMIRSDVDFKHITMPPEALQLLDQLAQSSFDMTIKNLTDAATGVIKSPADIEFPNAVLLANYFEPYAVETEKLVSSDVILMDMYSPKPLKHDIDDYENWGPLLSFDKCIEVREKHGVTAAEDIAAREFANNDGMDKIAAILPSYDLRDDDQIQFEPWVLI